MPTALAEAKNKAPELASDGRVWSALIYAHNETPEQPQSDPGEFPQLTQRLAKVFPFQHYHVLGSNSQEVLRQYESWIVPSRDVFLKLDSKGQSRDGSLNLHLQVWQDRTVLIKTDTILRPQSPLFIAGPKWRKGQLIFVLELQ